MIVRKLPFIALALIILMLVATTIVEKAIGSATIIYSSWWFAASWTLLTVSAFIYCLRGHLQRRLVVFMLHVALGVILVGALVTHLWGEQGSVHLRLGQSQHTFISTDGQPSTLPFALRLDDFEIVCYPGTTTHRDYVSTVRANIEAGPITISMNHIAELRGYRLYQSSYDSDLNGTVLSVCHDPWGIGITYTGYALLFLSMCLLLFLPHQGFGRTLKQTTTRQRILLSCILVATGCLVWFVVSRIYSKPLIPVLRSPYLGIHVGIIVVAYSLLAVNFITALIVLVLQALKPHHHAFANACFQFSRLLLYPALFCLTAGIFIGAIWANASWGRYWGWDPKEVWALITMLVYAFAFHSTSLPFFRRPVFYHTFMFFAFLAVLMTYFGVNYLLGGMHSYANT